MHTLRYTANCEEKEAHDISCAIMIPVCLLESYLKRFLSAGHV